MGNECDREAREVGRVTDDSYRGGLGLVNLMVCRRPYMSSVFVLMLSNVLYSTPARAQQPSQTEENAEPHFAWHPSLKLTSLGYDSNIYNDPSNPQGDFFAIGAGGVRPVWHLGETKMSADTGF